MRGYDEKLGRFLRWLDGTLADLTLEVAREFVLEMQRSRSGAITPRCRLLTPSYPPKPWPIT